MAEVNTNVETTEVETNEAVEAVEAQTTSRRSNKKKNIATEYVTFGPLFYDGGRYKDPVNVIWNGVKYSIPRGKVVSIPVPVAEILEQSAMQDSYAAAITEELQKPQIQDM